MRERKDGLESAAALRVRELADDQDCLLPQDAASDIASLINIGRGPRILDSGPLEASLSP